jgi:phage tail protein X
MKVRIAVFLTLLSSLIQARPALAAWGSFVSMGSTIVNSDISCAETTTGHVACAATSFGNTLVVNHFNGGRRYHVGAELCG